MYSEARADGRRSTLLGHETPLAEPVSGTSGEDEQRLQALGPSAGLDPFQQLVATLAMAVLGVHRQARQLTGIGIGNLVQGRAGDDHALALHHTELLDLALQHLAGTPHQDALLFQRADQLQQAAHVLDRRLAHPLELFLGHQGAATVAGEEFG